MNVLYLLAAEIDVQSIYQGLENRETGRGDQFLDELEEISDRLKNFPYSGRLQLDDYRRIVMLRFPYGIFYVVEGTRLAIHAILDLRQSPEAILRRLSRD